MYIPWAMVLETHLHPANKIQQKNNFNTWILGRFWNAIAVSFCQPFVFFSSGSVAGPAAQTLRTAGERV
jgi:hypothetical protein